MALIQNVIDPRPTMEYTLIYFLICINDKFMLVSKGIYLTELLKVNFVNHRMFAKNILNTTFLKNWKNKNLRKLELLQTYTEDIFWSFVGKVSFNVVHNFNFCIPFIVWQGKQKCISSNVCTQKILLFKRNRILFE